MRSRYTPPHGLGSADYVTMRRTIPPEGKALSNLVRNLCVLLLAQTETRETELGPTPSCTVAGLGVYIM